ncbi:hypothetical protein ACS0TY_005157 [Phlomoides rotata]
MMPKTGDFSEDPFKSGAEIEVSFEEEGFRGSWFSATVLRHVSKRTNKKPRLLVQFHTLTAGDDNCKGNAQPLRETVDLVLVRPIPPRESQRRFNVGEDVDAFHSDGWWEGVVMSVNDDGGTTYAVFFRSSREQLLFQESQLRLHREWVNGKWVPPLEDETIANEGSPPERT